jgi:hypothetical protein
LKKDLRKVERIFGVAVEGLGAYSFLFGISVNSLPELPIPAWRWGRLGCGSARAGPARGLQPRVVIFFDPSFYFVCRAWVLRAVFSICYGSLVDIADLLY